MNSFVIDVGNTHTVLGFYTDNCLEVSWRVSSDRTKTEDELFGIIKSLFAFKYNEIPAVDKIAISSVVPELTRVFSHLSEKYFKKEAIVVTAYTNLGLSFPMENPGFIGSDLIVNAFAAKEIYKDNCIVCDFGTATTIQLVGKDGYFFGTSIIPGVMTSASGLFQKASKLFDVQIGVPKELLGTNTQNALVSGIVNGNAFMVDGFIQKIKSEFSYLGRFKSIATGGISTLISQCSSQIEIVDKNLMLDGLNLICNKH